MSSVDFDFTTVRAKVQAVVEQLPQPTEKSRLVFGPGFERPVPPEPQKLVEFYAYETIGVTLPAGIKVTPDATK